MVFQFTGEIQLSLGRDNQINNRPARAGTNRRCFYQPFFFADQAADFGPGVLLYSLENLFYC